jgi:hypothetical protein
MNRDDTKDTRGWFVETEEELAATEEMESASDRTAAIVIATLVETRVAASQRSTTQSSTECV